MSDYRKTERDILLDPFGPWSEVGGCANLNNPNIQHRPMVVKMKIRLAQARIDQFIDDKAEIAVFTINLRYDIINKLNILEQKRDLKDYQLSQLKHIRELWNL